MTTFERVLVANRGEIAVRVLSTLRRLGIVGIAVAAADDREAPHVRAADAVVHLEGSGPGGGYLSVERLIDAARRTGAQAIHPGYGFLSESPRLARACEQAGIVFIGPPADIIATMGDKIAAKEAVAAAGVPVVPGVHRPGMSETELIAAADEVGYPVLIKAAAGGGGRGMRVVRQAPELPDAVAAARREATAAFSDDALFLERLVDRPRHIEIQVVADNHGTIWALTERECSLQRRHQKIVEESPSAVLHPTTRSRMMAAATAVARGCGYRGVGTIEFLLPGATAAQQDAPFYFLEMNTRLQVEHRVTEAIHGLDLVAWQVRIAAGEPLAARPPEPSGHAIEARVYAEDPARSFLPTGGTVHAYAEPHVDGVAVDSGVRAGTVVGMRYDPLLAKVIAVAASRSGALDRLRAGLRSFVTLGVRTNNAFLQALLAHEDVRDATLDTGLIERDIEDLLGAAERADLRAVVPVVVAVASLCARQRQDAHASGTTPAGRPADTRPATRTPAGWRLHGRAPTVLNQRIGGGEGGRDHRVVVVGDPGAATVTVDDSPMVRASGAWRGPQRLAVVIDGLEMVWDVARLGSSWIVGRAGSMWVATEQALVEAEGGAVPSSNRGPVTAPMPGIVTMVEVAVGDAVVAGKRLLVVEAMKMEHPVLAHMDGVVARLHVAVGATVAMGEPLADIAPESRTAEPAG